MERQSFKKMTVVAAALTSAVSAIAIARDVPSGRGGTQWVDVLEPAYLGPGIGSDGEDIVAFTPLLRKYNPNGQLVWERDFGIWGGGEQVVRPTGEIFGTITVGELPWIPVQLNRYDRDGLNPVGIASGYGDCCYVQGNGDPAGNYVVTYIYSVPADWISYHGADDTQWDFPRPPFQFHGEAKLDPFGNVVIIGNLGQPVTYRGRELDAGFTIFKLSRTGELIWTKQLPGRVEARMDFSAIGTIVLAASTMTPFNWGGESFQPNPSGSEYLIVVEGADGSERFARLLFDGPTIGPWGLPGFFVAVDPPGQAAVALDLRSGATVFKYNLAGEFLWQRDFSSDGGTVDFQGLAFSERNVIASGTFSGTVDFGLGPEQSDVRRGFIVSLGP
jgi:hypothetical protein